MLTNYYNPLVRVRIDIWLEKNSVIWKDAPAPFLILHKYEYAYAPQVLLKSVNNEISMILETMKKGFLIIMKWNFNIGMCKLWGSEDLFSEFPIWSECLLA